MKKTESKMGRTRCIITGGQNEHGCGNEMEKGECAFGRLALSDEQQ